MRKLELPAVRSLPAPLVSRKRHDPCAQLLVETEKPTCVNKQHEAPYLALSSTPLLVAVAFSAGLAIRRSDMAVDWGSVAEWAGAIGSSAAVVVALWIAINDARRRESERKDEQAAQARLLVVEAHEDDAGGVLNVKVTNHSSSPVFAVVVEAVHVTPYPLRVRFFSKREWARLDPGESKQAGCYLFAMDGITIATIEAPNIVSADVSFVDSAGFRWKRWGNTPPRGGAPIRRREPPERVPEVASPTDVLQN